MTEIANLFSYAFFRNAFMAATLTSVIAGIVGTYIVTRRSVFISGGITHASFGGIGIAYYFGLPPFLGAALFAILSALGIEWTSHKAGIREDSAIAILWSLGMAIGILFVFLTPGYTPNLMGFLFGDILSVKPEDLLGLAILVIALLILLFFFYEPILYTAFDADFARVSKMPVQIIRLVIAAFIALSIVLSIKVMGIILVLSLFAIPPSAANLFAKRFSTIMWWSSLISLTGSLAGMFIAYFFDLPSGATIIFTLSVIYLLMRAVKYFSVRIK